MSAYKIIGGKPLKGTVNPIANKNSILKLIPASILTDEPVFIHNVPQSTDVRLMIKIVKQLGGKVHYFNKGTSIKIVGKNINSYEIDPELSRRIKASVMFMAPLLLRLGKAHMPVPGGCKLGKRPLDAFMENMEQMGAKYTRDKGYFIEAKRLKSNKIWSWFPSVTGTENLVMLAVLTPGRTEIYNAASEPHTQDLCNMLVSMGAKIQGIGSNHLIIDGVENLSGTEWTVISDHLDVGAYIAAAALTRGEVTIKNAIPQHMGMILQVFDKFGVRVKIDGDSIFVPAKQKLKCKLTVSGDLLDIKAFSWPHLPPDFIHVAIVTALKARGNIVFHNSFYEYGFFFIEELAKMKANLVMADPYRLITFGPTKFQGGRIFTQNIIQASMALFLAAVSAEGETILEDRNDSLLRRYPDLIAKYSKLGANVAKA